MPVDRKCPHSVVAALEIGVLCVRMTKTYVPMQPWTGTGIVNAMLLLSREYIWLNADSYGVRVSNSPRS